MNNKDSKEERDANWKCNDDEGDIKRKGECPFGQEF